MTELPPKLKDSIDESLARGVDPKAIWKAVCAPYLERGAATEEVADGIHEVLRQARDYLLQRITAPRPSLDP